MLKADGSALGNSNVPNSTTLTVTPSGQNFVLNIPISPGSYSIPNVTIKVYNGSRSNCCFTQTSYTIVNNDGSNPVLNGIIDGKRITTQNGLSYAIINSQYTILSVLPNGNVKLTYTVASRPADNGTACLPVTMFSYMTDQFNGELDALKSVNGLSLPRGTHLTLYTYWTDPALFTKLSEVEGNELWTAWGNPEGNIARNHNGGADWSSIEIY